MTATHINPPLSPWERGPGGAAGLHATIRLRRGRFTLDAALAAPAGVTALLGPSGAGKSLTLQAIAGLTPIEAGRVMLNGRALADTQTDIALPPRMRRVGYVPQSYALFPHLSVANNIAYGLPRELDRAARAKRVADLLALGRLEGYENRRPRDLSGGEAQRVAVLRALAAEPEALLLDEPFSALDAPTRAAVRDDLAALIAASGLPALLVTHDLAEARTLASRLALLVDGRVVVEGPTAEALAAPPTLRAARLLGWSAALPVAGYEMADGAALVTLACGQRLALDASAVAPDLRHTPSAASVALALRPERLTIARGAADEDEEREPAPRAALRGMIGLVRDDGGAISLLVTLDGAGAEPLPLALNPREWAALALSPGERVTLRPLPGALRLVAREDAP
ncbi:MAG TPA: ABC transporter ATP-binding protein [Ktedonobacterales bacterium]|nr:ABC transporter ATP-binding protein [Ktedonobacterales bacterium]